MINIFEYLRLVTREEKRQAAYRHLFKAHIPEKALNSTSNSTNKT